MEQVLGQSSYSVKLCLNQNKHCNQQVTGREADENQGQEQNDSENDSHYNPT